MVKRLHRAGQESTTSCNTVSKKSQESSKELLPTQVTAAQVLSRGLFHISSAGAFCVFAKTHSSYPARAGQAPLQLSCSAQSSFAHSHQTKACLPNHASGKPVCYYSSPERSSIFQSTRLLPSQKCSGRQPLCTLAKQIPGLARGFTKSCSLFRKSYH